MDNLTKLKTLIGLHGDSEDAILKLFLEIAGEKVLNRLYPYRDDVKSVPEKYRNKQVEIALYLYNKQGAEGEIAHTENGISRSYASADIPEDLLSGITPYVGVL